MRKVLKFPKISRQINKSSCGANALKSIIKYYLGENVSEKELCKIAKTTKKEGTSVPNLIRAAKKFKLKYLSKHNLTIKDLKNSIDREIPVVVLVQEWADRKISDWSGVWEFGHYVTVVGYDRDKIIFYDPFNGKKRFLSYKDFSERWHDKDNKIKYNHFGIFFG